MRVDLRVDVIVLWKVSAFPSQVRRPLTALHRFTLLLSHPHGSGLSPALFVIDLSKLLH
jgi:hypothetical protein